MRPSALLLALALPACATTSIEAVVTRAPVLPVHEAQRIALATPAITGSTRYRTAFACGGNTEGELGAIPEARLAGYRAEFEAVLHAVLVQNGVSVVSVGEADQTLEVGITVVETENIQYHRCDQEQTGSVVTCLPDPEIDGKSQCGCVLVSQGKLSPDPYHFVVDASGQVTVEVTARLLSRDGALVAEHTIQLVPAPGFDGGVVSCHGVQGQPEVLEQCQDVVTSLASGTTIRARTPDWKEAFRASFSNAASPERGGTVIHDAMFPFEARVRFAVFRLREPRDVAQPAVRALRNAKYEEAVAHFERGLDLVQDGGVLSPRARARYLYDYGVALLSTGRRDEATAAIEEASGILPDRRFAAGLAEIERERADEVTLDTAPESALVVPVATPPVPAKEPEASARSLDEATTPLANDAAATPAGDIEERESTP